MKDLSEGATCKLCARTLRTSGSAQVFVSVSGRLELDDLLVLSAVQIEGLEMASCAIPSAVGRECRDSVGKTSQQDEHSAAG